MPFQASSSKALNTNFIVVFQVGVVSKYELLLVVYKRKSKLGLCGDIKLRKRKQ